MARRYTACLFLARNLTFPIQVDCKAITLVARASRRRTTKQAPTLGPRAIYVLCWLTEFGDSQFVIYDECVRLGIEMLEMAIGFEDLTAAYRFVPNSQPTFIVFCVWRFSDADGKCKATPVFYYVPGHDFGMVSSVLNFNRFPKLMVAMARSILALPVSQYFDDYFIMDLCCTGSSGQLGLQQLHLLANPPLDAGKRQSMAE